MPERVGVEVDTHDGSARAEAGVGDEGVDAGDVLRGRLMRGDRGMAEVPVVALDEARSERAGDSCLG
ncbi:MAG: hypothetical protein ABWX92_09235 [Mycetocola sp.]